MHPTMNLLASIQSQIPPFIWMKGFIFESFPGVNASKATWAGYFDY